MTFAFETHDRIVAGDLPPAKLKKQQEKHLSYVKNVKAIKEIVEEQLEQRRDDAASVMTAAQPHASKPTDQNPSTAAPVPIQKQPAATPSLAPQQQPAATPSLASQQQPVAGRASAPSLQNVSVYPVAADSSDDSDGGLGDLLDQMGLDQDMSPSITGHDPAVVAKVNA